MNKGRGRNATHAGANENVPSSGLPYIIELWNLPRTKVERVVARADTLSVARAIFDSAASENPSRRIVLRRGDQVLEDRT